MFFGEICLANPAPMPTPFSVKIRRILANQSEEDEQDVLERYLLDVQCEFGRCLMAFGNYLFARWSFLLGSST